VQKAEAATGAIHAEVQRWTTRGYKRIEVPIRLERFDQDGLIGNYPTRNGRPISISLAIGDRPTTRSNAIVPARRGTRDAYVRGLLAKVFGVRVAEVSPK